MAALRPDSEDDDAEEITEVVPAAVVGHRVDGDVVSEQRHHPGEREDEAVPEARQEAGCSGRDCTGLLRRDACGLEAARKSERVDQCECSLKYSASALLGW